MKLEIGKQSSINAILMMGIFTFLFLGVEYYFVKLIVLMVDGNSTVAAQNYALGIIALGFLLYPLFHRCLKKRIRQICTLLLAMAAVFCIFLMERRFSYALVLFPGMAAFLILGLFGSATYHLSMCTLETNRYLARQVGIAYALSFCCNLRPTI